MIQENGSNIKNADALDSLIEMLKLNLDKNKFLLNQSLIIFAALVFVIHNDIIDFKDLGFLKVLYKITAIVFGISSIAFAVSIYEIYRASLKISTLKMTLLYVDKDITDDLKEFANIRDNVITAEKLGINIWSFAFGGAFLCVLIWLVAS